MFMVRTQAMQRAATPAARHLACAVSGKWGTDVANVNGRCRVKAWEYQRDWM